MSTTTIIRYNYSVLKATVIKCCKLQNGMMCKLYPFFVCILGMLIVGGMLSNIPVIKTVGQGLDLQWSGALRYSNTCYIFIFLANDVKYKPLTVTLSCH